MSGGFIASCRNPVRASYVKKNAALGGISRALELGNAIMAAEGKGGQATIDAICKATSGTILGKGKVTRKAVTYTEAAFDIGTITINCGARDLVLHVMNEYMAVADGDGARLATFPDVITTLDADGRPMSVGHIREGVELSVVSHRQGASAAEFVGQGSGGVSGVRGRARNPDQQLRAGVRSMKLRSPGAASKLHLSRWGEVN